MKGPMIKRLRDLNFAMLCAVLAPSRHTARRCWKKTITLPLRIRPDLRAGFNQP
jgi:hypothetical protein